MKQCTPSPLACRYCRYYQIEGRRGGHCEKLGVPVKGVWQSCALMQPSFSICPLPTRSHGIILEQYTSEIYSYENSAKLKSGALLPPTKASK